MGQCAPAVTQDSCSVSVIDIQERTVVFAESCYLHQGSDIPIHAEYAVGNDYFLVAFGCLHKHAQMGGITVPVYCLLRPAEPAGIDKACVIKFVAENDIAFPGNRRQCTGICNIAGTKN